MPLQHAHPATLRRMRRPANIDWVYKTLDSMRSRLPELALRTTFIVGYPGETEDVFQALLDFVQQLRFDRVGAFQFSFEPGTTSEALGDPIPPEVKQERYERLMELQQGIALEKNQDQGGKTLPVLIEGSNNGLSVGRSYRDAPEIDGMVIVEGEQPVGEIVPVRITGAMVYDLSGIPAAAVFPPAQTIGLSDLLSTSSCKPYADEIQFALQAVRQASLLIRQVVTAEIKVHPNGRFLYVSNRGHDSLAVVAIDESGEKLTFVVGRADRKNASFV